MNRMKKAFVVLLGGLALSAIQPAVAQTPFPAFDTEAHRGGRGLMPENTIPAMKHAIDLRVTTLEMDVLFTKDKKVIVSHDAYINHLFSLTPEGKTFTKEDQKNYIIYKMDYSEVKKFDVGSKPHPNFPDQHKMNTYKPLLSELIDSTELYMQQQNVAPMWYNIETKSVEGHDGEWQPAPKAFVKGLMKVLQQKKITQRVVIQSFDKRTLQVLHRSYPYMKTSMLIDDKDQLGLEGNIKALGFTPFVYSPHYKLVDAALVKACKDKGIKLVPWTVNTAEEMARLKALGVDGIISDYPNLF
jgi:glycerophosphoryl diester phosphodiesterase